MADPGFRIMLHCFQCIPQKQKTAHRAQQLSIPNIHFAYFIDYYWEVEYVNTMWAGPVFNVKWWKNCKLNRGYIWNEWSEENLINSYSALLYIFWMQQESERKEA